MANNINIGLVTTVFQKINKCALLYNTLWQKEVSSIEFLLLASDKPATAMIIVRFIISYNTFIFVI
jgi:hypothetical protein